MTGKEMGTDAERTELKVRAKHPVRPAARPPALGFYSP